MPWWYITGYVVIAFIGVVYSGMTCSEGGYDEDERIVGHYLCAILWPITIVAFLLYLISAGPWKLGRYLRDKKYNRKQKVKKGRGDVR